MTKIQAVEEIALGVILLYQWLINRRMLRITEALRKRIEELERNLNPKPTPIARYREDWEA